jgi:2-dehydro-3-deoxy-D-arabinonate dehydratase
MRTVLVAVLLVSDPAGVTVAVVASLLPILAVTWHGSTSTSRLRRSLTDLTGYVFAAEQFPDGVVLSTGTGIVPELDFTLQEGDQATVSVEEAVTVTNVIAVGLGRFGWLADRPPS